MKTIQTTSATTTNESCVTDEEELPVPPFICLGSPPVSTKEFWTVLLTSGGPFRAHRRPPPVRRLGGVGKKTRGLGSYRVRSNNVVGSVGVTVDSEMVVLVLRP